MTVRFLERLGLSLPIVQAPMAGISTVTLAAEVAKTGALGSLPMALVDLTKNYEPVFTQLETFRELAGARAKVNLNFFCHDYREQTPPTCTQKENWYTLYSAATSLPVSELREIVPELEKSNISFAEFEDLHPTEFAHFVDRLVQSTPTVVSFHFGIPSENAIKKLQKGGIFVMATATSVAEAELLFNVGVDGLVLQGHEAGGHRGNFLSLAVLDENLPTSLLFDQVQKKFAVLEHKPLLIPAGGITTAAGAASFLLRGAAAVQLGTIFVPVSESSAPEFIAKSAREHKNIPTVMTGLVSGKVARALRTPFIEKLAQEQARLQLDLPSYGYAYFGYKKIAQKLRPEYGFFLAGLNYHGVRAESAKDVVSRIASGLQN